MHALRTFLIALLGIGCGLAALECCGRLLGRALDREFLIPVEKDGTTWLVPRRYADLSVTPFRERAANGVFRIAALGGSATIGVPYAPPISIWYWLEDELETRLPGIDVEILNLGVPGANIETIERLERELPEGSIDAAFVYVGNNEFLGTYVWPELLREAPSLFDRIEEHVLSSSFVTWMRNDVLEIPKPRLATGKPPRSTSDPGTLAIRAAIERRSLAAYESLLRRLKARSIPVISILPPSDLGEVLPVGEYLEPTLSEAERQAAVVAVANARSLLNEGRPEEALLQADRAIQAVPTLASALNEKARALRRLSRDAEAERALERAEDLDLWPLGATPHMRKRLETIAREHQVAVLDGERLFQTRHEEEPETRLLHDNVHPTYRGQIVLAHGLAETMRTLDWPRAHERWNDAYRVPRELLANVDRAERELWTRVAELHLLQAIEVGAQESHLRQVLGEFLEARERTPDSARTQIGLGLCEFLLGEPTAGDRIRDALARDASLRPRLKQLARRVPELKVFL